MGEAHQRMDTLLMAGELIEREAETFNKRNIAGSGGMGRSLFSRPLDRTQWQ